MFASWRLPKFLLQSLHVSAKDYTAVLEGSLAQEARKSEDAILLCVTTQAEASGVREGMTASQGLARCSKLKCIHRSEEAEKRLQNTLLEFAEGWTADFESTKPGLCLLDLSRIYRRQKISWVEEAALMHQEFLERGYELCVGLAGTPDLAMLASHVAKPIRVLHDSLSEENATFAELPLSVLSSDLQLLKILALWGITTLGELKVLKRQAVGERLGPAGLELWDLANGGKQRLLSLVKPKVGYQKEAEIEGGIETLEPLLHLLKNFVSELTQELSLTWQVASHLHLRMRFDDGTSHQKDLRIAEPTRATDVLMRILETHLESVKASAPVIYLSLSISPSLPSTAQDLLFERGLKNPSQFAETLSALEALIGAGRVGRGHLLPTHYPDSFTITPFLEKTVREEGPLEPSHGLLLSRFRPPWKVTVRFQNAKPAWLDAPNKSMRVVRSAGPWLLSGHWWDTRLAWRQELWDVAAHDGSLYRLVRDRETWRLEGRYV